MPKRSLRHLMLTRRRALSDEEVVSSGQQAQNNLMDLEAFAAADCVALYAAIHNEVDTGLVCQRSFALGKRVLYPKVFGHHMVFRQVEHAGQLVRGHFGIMEPFGDGVNLEAEAADLIVIPGVAFDCRGHRIGYGKGYYDRFLQHAGPSTRLVGICHDFQLIEGDIPAEYNDIRMDLVVTERRVVLCGSNRRHP